MQFQSHTFKSTVASVGKSSQIWWDTLSITDISMYMSFTRANWTTASFIAFRFFLLNDPFNLYFLITPSHTGFPPLTRFWTSIVVWNNLDISDYHKHNKRERTLNRAKTIDAMGNTNDLRNIKFRYRNRYANLIAIEATSIFHALALVGISYFSSLG